MGIIDIMDIAVVTIQVAIDAAVEGNTTMIHTLMWIYLILILVHYYPIRMQMRIRMSLQDYIHLLLERLRIIIFWQRELTIRVVDDD